MSNTASAQGRAPPKPTTKNTNTPRKGRGGGKSLPSGHDMFIPGGTDARPRAQPEVVYDTPNLLGQYVTPSLQQLIRDGDVTLNPEFSSMITHRIRRLHGSRVAPSMAEKPVKVQSSETINVDLLDAMYLEDDGNFLTSTLGMKYYLWRVQRAQRMQKKEGAKGQMSFGRFESNLFGHFQSFKMQTKSRASLQEKMAFWKWLYGRWFMQMFNNEDRWQKWFSQWAMDCGVQDMKGIQESYYRVWGHMGRALELYKKTRSRDEPIAYLRASEEFWFVEGQIIYPSPQRPLIDHWAGCVELYENTYDVEQKKRLAQLAKTPRPVCKLGPPDKVGYIPSQGIYVPEPKQPNLPYEAFSKAVFDFQKALADGLMTEFLSEDYHTRLAGKNPITFPDHVPYQPTNPNKFTRVFMNGPAASSNKRRFDHVSTEAPAAKRIRRETEPKQPNSVIPVPKVATPTGAQVPATAPGFTTPRKTVPMAAAPQSQPTTPNPVPKASLVETPEWLRPYSTSTPFTPGFSNLWPDNPYFDFNKSPAVGSLVFEGLSPHSDAFNEHTQTQFGQIGVDNFMYPFSTSGYYNGPQTPTTPQEPHHPVSPYLSANFVQSGYNSLPNVQTEQRRQTWPQQTASASMAHQQAGHGHGVSQAQMNHAHGPQPPQNTQSKRPNSS